MAALGLRGKSLLALLLACCLALVPSLLIGWQVVEGMRDSFAQAYARNTTLLNREKVFAPISRELALSKRFADAGLTRQWLLDEDDPAKRAAFFDEAEGFRRDFRDHSYSVASALSRNYYFNSEKAPLTDQPSYQLQVDNDLNSWFFATLRNTKDYNINVDQDALLGVTNIWFNVIIRDQGRKIGIAGTALDLSAFVRDFISSAEPGVTPMIFDFDGIIQAHPQLELIALNSGSGGKVRQDSRVFQQLGSKADERALLACMQEAKTQPEKVAMCWVTLADKQQLMALSYIPELRWFVVTALDLRAAQLIDKQLLTLVLLALLVLLLALIMGFAYAVEKLVLRPLRLLQTSAQNMAAGNYDVVLPTARDDEIGHLSAAFNVMARTVRNHTEELEGRVLERTQELEQANLDMQAAHRKIDDSIDYASLIQRAILPDRHLVSSLGDRHSVLWRPRDVVGGDFYVYRSTEHGCLFGVVDCAGHGVPGALMTMLAYAAIDQALADAGLDDPAATLARADQIVRNMLGNEVKEKALATNMDVGLAYVDLRAREVIFSGAKIALYYSDGARVDELPGARRAIGDKRIGTFENARMPLANRTFYMATDGFLDQAGGDHGFGFGSSRFAEMICQHARLPISEQGNAFANVLAEYQGSFAQRDDITMLCFHFAD